MITHVQAITSEFPYSHWNNEFLFVQFLVLFQFQHLFQFVKSYDLIEILSQRWLQKGKNANVKYVDGRYKTCIFDFTNHSFALISFLSFFLSLLSLSRIRRSCLTICKNHSTDKRINHGQLTKSSQLTIINILLYLI